jgi:ketosteroid isomerase-like protein
MFKTTPCGWDSATQSLGEWLEGPEVTFLRLWYDTLNPDLLNPDIHWHNLDGSPYGGTFIGRAAVRDGYFAPLQRDFEDWRVTVEEVIGSGSAGHIIVRGHFHGRARTTGIEVTVPFANFWKVRGGKIFSVQQYTDTRILADALAGKIPREQTKTGAE